MTQVTRRTHDSYLESLAKGVEAWTAQDGKIAITGGYSDPRQNQPMMSEWQKHPITNVGEYWRQVEAVSFQVRGIADIHGEGFGTFALDMDKKQGRDDFEWLLEFGHLRPGELIMDTPGGHHVIVQHDPRLSAGTVKHPEGAPEYIILDGFDGPRGDGTLHVTLRGYKGANVTKLPPTVRPVTGEAYTARQGWRYEPLPLWDWFRLPERQQHTMSEVSRQSERSFTGSRRIQLSGTGLRKGAITIVNRMCDELAALSPHTARNNTLNKHAFDAFINLVLREGSLTVREVADAFSAAAQACDLPDHETEATLKSAWGKALEEFAEVGHMKEVS